MNVTGIVAEYNPFHKGHEYHIGKARELTNADYVVIVMSGNYVQRGVPAVMDKYLRTEMALKCGADLVLELPLPYAVSSAEYFASGAVALLDKLGIVNTLCFGSECGNADALMQIADYLISEPFSYKKFLQKYLLQGLSYPAAQEAALFSCTDEDTAKLLAEPNNRLGIEYCKALQRRNSKMKPYAVLREGSGYHDASLSAKTPFSSATAIRNAMIQSPEIVSNFVPCSVYEILSKEWQTSFPITEDDFSLPLHYKLLSETKQSLLTYLDINSDLADKILKFLPEYTTFSNFCTLLKSKDMTYTRLSRCLLHILLDIKKEHMDYYSSAEFDQIGYAKILGFKKEASELLHEMKVYSSIPIISKMADASKIMPLDAYEMLQREVKCNHVYEAVKANKFTGGTLPLKNEYTRGIVIL